MDKKQEELRQQVGAQCNAVAVMAEALARVHHDYAVMLHNGHSDALLDQIGRRTAELMEELGDILNGMDSVSEDDAWMEPVFEKAHQMFPQAALSAISAEPVGHVDMQTPCPGDRIRWTNAAMPHGAPLYASPLPQAAQPDHVEESLTSDQQHWFDRGVEFAEKRAAVDTRKEQSLPEQAAPGVPEGWKLVPIEPIPRMLGIAIEDEGTTIVDGPAYARQLYKEMIAVAPASPSPAPALSAVDAQKVRNDALAGFDVGELADVAEGLENGYEKTVNVGNVTGEGDAHLETATAYAARFIRAYLEAALQSQPASAGKDAEDARQFKPRELVTLNGKQLKDLLDYAWPDMDDEDQADSELTLIAHDTPFKSTEGDDMPAGLYCYFTEYPEEGIILIDEKGATK